MESRFKFSREVNESIEELESELTSNKSRVIVFDGQPGSGKSTHARYFAFRLGLSCVHMDMFLLGQGPDVFHNCMLEYIRHGLKWRGGLIVDGVFSARWLEENSIEWNYLFRLERQNLVRNHYKPTEYEDQYKPDKTFYFSHPIFDQN